MPRIAPQGSVYGSVLRHPAHPLPEGALLEFTLRPEKAPGAPPRILDLRIVVHASINAPRPASPVYALANAADSEPPAVLSGDGLAARVAALVHDGRDPFARIGFDRALRLDEARDAARFLNDLEREDRLRVDSPEPGQLFFRAFIPDESNRRREDRIAQPKKLRLWRDATGRHALLTTIEERWRDDRIEPDLIPADRPVESPEALTVLLREAAGLPVILVFAPPELTVGDVMDYVAPVLATHRLVHVYVDLAAGAPAN